LPLPLVSLRQWSVYSLDSQFLIAPSSSLQSRAGHRRPVIHVNHCPALLFHNRFPFPGYYVNRFDSVSRTSAFANCSS
jgi:hypothetical protein